MTSRELLQITARRLKQHGIEEPQIEARILLGHAVELSYEQLLANFDKHPSESQIEKLEQWVVRRISHEPIAYIIQSKDFYGLNFYVDHRVLIPRPETELLVEKALDFDRNNHLKHPLTIADIGTGSGAIIISIAKNVSDSTFYAIDISAEALEVARINSKKHGVENQITFLHGDLLVPLPVPVDIIAANLPYIDAPAMSRLPPDIAHFEPVTALAGGEDGLRYIEKLLQQTPAKINNGGCILLEIGMGQRSMMAGIIDRYFPNAAITFFKDLGGIDRIVQIQPDKIT